MVAQLVERFSLNPGIVGSSPEKYRFLFFSFKNWKYVYISKKTLFTTTRFQQNVKQFDIKLLVALKQWIQINPLTAFNVFFIDFYTIYRYKLKLKCTLMNIQSLLVWKQTKKKEKKCDKRNRTRDLSVTKRKWRRMLMSSALPTELRRLIKITC